MYECTALQDLWESVAVAALFQRATTMQQFMWQPDLMREAQILAAGVRRMRKVPQAIHQTSHQPGWLEQM